MEHPRFPPVMAQKTDRRPLSPREERIATLERYTGRSMQRKVLRIDSLVGPAPPPQADPSAHHGYAAFLISRKQEPKWTPPPDAPPICQADTFDAVMRQLQVPPWEQVYELGVHELPREVPDIRDVVPAKGARILVRVHDSGHTFPRWPDYEYFQVQSPELPADPVLETGPQPPSQNAPVRKKSGSGYYDDREAFLAALIDVIDNLWRKFKKLGKRPSIQDAVNEDYRDLWPECLQPSRKEFYNLRRDHSINFHELVLSRKAIALGRSG